MRANSPAGEYRRLDLPDAEVSYCARIDLGGDPEAVLRALIREVAWEQREVVVWGRKRRQPRLSAWYGDAGCEYSYSGLCLAPLPWTPLLARLRRAVEAAAGASFNSVLLNYYRDHRDGMGYHSDDEPALGRRPVIASLTLGEARPFVMKHRGDPSVPLARLRPGPGSLLVMRGDTQRNWRHAVPKQTRACGPRVNLTFRTIAR